MQRPILLVGAGGQVGRELQTALAPLGNVIPTVRSTSGHVAPANSITLDLTNVAELRRVVRQVRPSLIVNAAAYTAVAQAEADREATEAINAIAPGVLAEEAFRANAALIHYSTDYIFDGSGNQRWSEDHKTAPLNVYGRTKLAGETAIRNSGAAHLLLRVAWIYSAHGKNFVKTILRLARDQDELQVVNDQVGAADVGAANRDHHGADPEPGRERSHRISTATRRRRSRLRRGRDDLACIGSRSSATGARRWSSRAR